MALTKESLNATFEYRDGVLYRRKDTSRSKAGDAVGTLGTNGYLSINIEYAPRLVHRLIWMMHHGSVPKFLDHINGNRLDNRIENLRPATRTENNRNSPVQKNNKLGVKGVCKHGNTGKYRSRICVNRKIIELGYFKTILEASAAYNAAAKKYHGEFANNGSFK